MVYKFRSLCEPDLTLPIRDTDNDQVTVTFTKYSPENGVPFGLFETEDEKIGKAMIKSPDNGVKYMDADYVERKKAQDTEVKKSHKREKQAKKDAPQKGKK